MATCDAVVARAVSLDDAVKYVGIIRDRFVDSPEMYDEFLALLHSCKTRECSVQQEMDAVCFLFADHPDLLYEFINFIPDEEQEQAWIKVNQFIANNAMVQDKTL